MSGSSGHSLLKIQKGKHETNERILNNFEPPGRQLSQGHLPGSQYSKQETRISSGIATPTSQFTSYSRKRHILKDIGNVPLPRFLRSRSTSGSGESISYKSATSGHTAISESQANPLKHLNDHEADINSLENTLRPVGSMTDTPRPVHQATTLDIPIGTTRPLPLNTRSLCPKIHKLAMGTITVLKSGSLLVDFRQNQRRLELKGDQVLVISSQGTSVRFSVFSLNERSLSSISR